MLTINPENQMQNAETKRASGRTSRLIDEAGRLAVSGVRVYVVGATQEHARLIAEAVKEKSGVGVSPVSSDDPRIDWESLRLRGVSPSESSVLFDHYAIERRYGRALNAWSKFD